MPNPLLEFRPDFDRRALLWLIGFDALWAIPELVTNVGSLLLIPLCLLGAAVPIYHIQRRAGDTPARALLKAIPCGIAAALPFPVCGTALGAILLAYIRKPGV